MDVFIFLTVVTFQVTLLAIVAIVFGQSKIAEQAIKSLSGILKGFSLKSGKDNTITRHLSKLGLAPKNDPRTSNRRRRRKTVPVKAIIVDEDDDGITNAEELIETSA